MTLNQAILQVISNKYKKDCKEAHEIVEAAGYTINKNYGCFYVRNPKTHKYVYMEFKMGYRKDYYELNWGSSGYGSKNFDSPEDAAVFDFANMLNLPYNNDARLSGYDDTWNKSKAMEKYITIKNLKRDVCYEEKEIKDILKQINQLQERLISTTERKVKYTTELNACRKEYGLKEER